MQKDRWIEQDEASLLQMAVEDDPHEFVTWPGYPHDDYPETLIARIKSF